MSPPRVSVALATCNGARFLRAQLTSIAAQSRPPDEIVACDDDSEDDTLRLLHSFANEAAVPVRVESNQRRLGVTRNFERAISLCTGDVIFLADQDDVWKHDKIRTLTDVLADRPAVGAVFSNGDMVDADGTPLGHSLWDSLGFDSIERHRILTGRALEVFLRHVVAAGTTLAFRSRYRDLALPFPDLESCHDAFVAFVISAVAEIAIVERPLIEYRLHGGNLIGIQRLTFRQQIEKARQQVEDEAFAYAVEFFLAARQRLLDRGAQVPTATLARIDEKILHARQRSAMSPRLAERLADIAKEIASGRYWRYSYGIRSVAQDLWLRG